MEIAHPYFLLSILIAPLLFVWFIRRGNYKYGQILFSSSKLIPDHIIQSSFLTVKLLVILKLVIFSLIIIALSGPRFSNYENLHKKEIIDILLILDQSSSMLAQDFKPNRLEAAKSVASKFVKNRNFQSMK